MSSGDDFDAWPDLITPRTIGTLFDLYPESKLLQLYALPNYSNERRAAWEDLGVTDPAKQQELEIELEKLINSLAERRECL